MPYYIDVLDALMPTTTVAEPPVQDAENFSSPYFFSCDLLGGDYNLSAVNARSAFINNNVGGYSLTDFLGHPGWMCLDITSAGVSGVYNSKPATYANTATNFAVFPGGPTTAFTYIFKTPKALSDASNSYYFSIGPCLVIASTATLGVESGWSLNYDRTVNSGNWTFSESVSNVVQVSSSASFPPVPNTWMRLTVTITPSNLVTAALTTCGLNDTQTIFSETSFALGTSGIPLPIYTCSMFMRREVSTGTVTTGAALDYYSMIIGTTGRTI